MDVQLLLQQDLLKLIQSACEHGHGDHLPLTWNAFLHSYWIPFGFPLLQCLISATVQASNQPSALASSAMIMSSLHSTALSQLLPSSPASTCTALLYCLWALYAGDPGEHAIIMTKTQHSLLFDWLLSPDSTVTAIPSNTDQAMELASIYRQLHRKRALVMASHDPLQPAIPQYQVPAGQLSQASWPSSSALLTDLETLLRDCQQTHQQHQQHTCSLLTGYVKAKSIISSHYANLDLINTQHASSTSSQHPASPYLTAAVDMPTIQ